MPDLIYLILLHSISWTLFTLILPIVLLIFLPLRIYKTIVILIAKKLNYRSTLTGYDSIFAIDSYYTIPYAGNATFLIINGDVSLEAVRKEFNDKILNVKSNGVYKYERLRQVPVNFMGFYFWADIENISIANHVKIAHDFGASKENLNEVLGKLMTRPFPINSSLWELLLLKGFEGNKTVVMLRLHHVLGDGYTANHIVDVLVGSKSTYMVKSVLNQTWIQFIARKTHLLLTAPSKLALLYLDAFTHRGHDVFTQPKISQHGLVSFTDLDLDLMKETRRKTQVHFATLGMSLLAGALARHFEEKPFNTNKSQSKVENSSPTINIMHSLPKPNHPLDKMVNHWAVGLFRIPFSNNISPLKRLTEAESYFNKYNADNYKEIIHYHMPLFNLLPSICVKLFFSTNFGTGMGFTSMPGVAGQSEFCGCQVERMYKLFGMQWSQTGLAAAVYTTGDKLGFTIYANKDVIDNQGDLDRITRVYLKEELNLLKKTIESSSVNNNETTAVAKKYK